ncbi:hypothetical protein [Streptomyces sparsogenes]|uniref:hypothetical protein n=1 Tax=Streptomyces sparsogenes TaxID=67365 RepID=UPI000AEC2ACC|nr:hypothetical protein [Streptomyces sparsogenes]
MGPAQAVGATVIDGTGRDPGKLSFRISAAEIAADIFATAGAALDAGFTTVRDTGGIDGGLVAGRVSPQPGYRHHSSATSGPAAPSKPVFRAYGP